MATHTTVSPLRALVDLISSSVDTIESAYAEQSESIPSLDDAKSDIPPVALDAEVLRARAILVSACSQLQATAQLPTTQIMHSASGHYLSACVPVAIQAHVAEAVRPAGSKGLHVREIAKFSPVNEDKLARCLRMLATHYIFREVSPNVFANNRLSVLLDTGKDAAQFAGDNPVNWFNDTDGHAAMLCYTAGENYQYAGYIAETMLDPETADSYEPSDAAYSRAVGRGYSSFFDYLSQPQTAFTRSLFNNAMVGVKILEIPDFILHKGLGWDKLAPGSVVVDVGGGVGTQTLKLAKAHPQLKLVVQDLPATIKEAHGFWEANDPAALSEGRVTLQAHSFFEPNPVKGAAVYFLREISHNWPDKEAITILRHVRDAANDESRIILINHVVQFVCPVAQDGIGATTVDWTIPTAPPPLLRNFGPASARAYNMDMTMLCQMNATERTPAHFTELTRQAGLKIDEAVGDTSNGDLVHLVCSRI